MRLPASILVVIPTLNEAAHIETVIRQLVSGLPLSEAWTLVVADGGSSDGTPDIVRRMGEEFRGKVKLLHNQKKLQSAAVNLAVVTYGQGHELMVRCDAHASYPADFLVRVATSLLDQHADALVVPMDSTGDAPLQKAIAWASDTKVGSGGSAHRGGRQSGFVDHGHHAGFKLDRFRAAGGYDETFSHNEDAELDCRQRAIGSRIYLDSDIRIGYYPRSTLSALWRQYKNYGTGRSRTIRKHPDSWRLRQLAVPLHLVLCMISIAGCVLSPAALAWPLFYITALAFVSAQVAIERRSAAGLLAGPAAFVMHTSWAIGFFQGLVKFREKPWIPDQQDLLPARARHSSNTAAP